TIATVTATLTLNAGTTNTITIANPSGWAPDIDRITVATGTAPPPTGSYEAEATGNALAGGAVVASCTGCSGGAKVGYLGNGATLKLTGIDGGTGGTRTITVSYTSAEARTFTIAANNGTPTTVNAPATTDWNTIATVTATLTLNAGTTNTITIANPSGWAPDIDRVVIS
ncbi:carbohydrate-binding protein, partial [Rugosimonospora africana]|uniref:carbohydrate-binding protein n=1 Tax=Rugosimonospora africana TaxID=556532 RepID=UPI001945491F